MEPVRVGLRKGRGPKKDETGSDNEKTRRGRRRMREVIEGMVVLYSVLQK